MILTKGITHMLTRWKSLIGKKVLIRLIRREGRKKVMTDLKEAQIVEVSESGIYIKIRTKELSSMLLNVESWHHRGDIKLCEVLI
jgi:hypothetical protein